jgi:hypothetical protein
VKGLKKRMTGAAYQCEHRLPSGRRCKAHPRSNDHFCFFHSEETAADRSRARRSGGMARSRAAAVLPPETPDNPLRNTQDVSTLLAESINQVRRGQLDPRVANSVGHLASILLGALQQGPLEERLARIEAALALEDNTKVKAV